MGATKYCNKMNNEYATWQVMEEYLPLEAQKEYRKIFNSLDENGVGVITVAQVARVIKSMNGRQCTTNNVRCLLRKTTNCDHEYSSTVQCLDFPEFLAVVSSLLNNCVSEDQILQIFNIFDQDGDGFIGREELRNLLSKLGDEVSEKEVEEMIEEADRDGDGLVSYHEFVRIITNSCDSRTARNECKNQTQTQSHSDLSTSIYSISDKTISSFSRPPSPPHPSHRRYRNKIKHRHSSISCPDILEASGQYHHHKNHGIFSFLLKPLSFSKKAKSISKLVHKS